MGGFLYFQLADCLIACYLIFLWNSINPDVIGNYSVDLHICPPICTTCNPDCIQSSLVEPATGNECLIVSLTANQKTSDA